MKKELLVIEDDKALGGLIIEHLKHIGCTAEIAHSWAEAKQYLDAHEPDLVLMDVCLPDADGMELLPQLLSDYPVVVMTAFASVKDAVRATKVGVEDYLAKPVSLDEMEIVVQRALARISLRAEHLFCKQRLQASEGRKLLIGHSRALQDVHHLINMVAATDMTVLIQGESGVGKELVAKTVHEHSDRSGGNFVAVDCCTLPEKLFESELFGFERGAFTGADRQKKGLVEGGKDGTLFLDEIGEIDLPVQAKLLRLIETNMFRRVGGTKDLRANVRIVAATNCDLEKAVEEGRFRSDLFYRLSAFVITVPPLRERREDIRELVDHFICNHDFSRRINTVVSRNAMRALTTYDWPGNVRELKNAVERAIILSQDEKKIRRRHLTASLTAGNSVHGVNLSFDHEPTFAEIEARYLSNLLKKYSGHRATVAERLGVSERSIYRLIDRYGL